MPVEIQIDTRELEKAQRFLGNIKNGVPRVLVPTINRALDSGRTALRREIRKEYLIKQKDIPIQMQRAVYGRLSGFIEVADKMLPLAKFKFRGGTRARPLFAQVKTSGGGVIPHGFVATMDDGFRGPFERVGKSRLPIRKLYSIGAPIMASRPEVLEAVEATMNMTLDKRLEHELQRVMNQAEKK